MREIHGVVVTNRQDAYDTVTVEDGMEGKIYLNVGDTKYVKLTPEKAEFLSRALVASAKRVRDNKKVRMNVPIVGSGSELKTVKKGTAA